MDNMSLCHVCSSRYAARRWGAAGAVAAVLLYYRTTIVSGSASSSSTAVLHHSAESRRIQPPYRSLIGLYYGVLWGGTVPKDEMEPSDWPVLSVGR